MAQIAVAAIAVLAAVVAWEQYRSAKLFVLLKFLEEPDIREARRLLYFNVVKENKKGIWWNDKDLEKAATAICVSYDILWRIAKWRQRRFFCRYWAHGICWTYETLKEFLDERREETPGSYQGFVELYLEAKPFDPKVIGWHRRCWLLRKLGR